MCNSSEKQILYLNINERNSTSFSQSEDDPLKKFASFAYAYMKGKLDISPHNETIAFKPYQSHDHEINYHVDLAELKTYAKQFRLVYPDISLSPVSTPRTRPNTLNNALEKKNLSTSNINNLLLNDTASSIPKINTHEKDSAQNHFESARRALWKFLRNKDIAWYKQKHQKILMQNRDLLWKAFINSKLTDMSACIKNPLTIKKLAKKE